jgi:hypothetical protein
VARAKRERPPDPDRLIRRSAGDLHTEDGRFEVSSTGGAGRWYVTDTERHDGLGLALVLGPFGTLDEVKAAIAEQRSAPTGADGPLPEPAAMPEPRRTSRATRQRRAEPEPEPEPEPPPRPPARIAHARWRARHDERDAVVEVVRRIIAVTLSDDPDEARADLHASMVAVRGSDRLEGRDAVLGAWRKATDEAPVIAWTEREPMVDVVGGSAVMRYRYELEREMDGIPTTGSGDDLWVLTRDEDRWLAAYRMTLPDTPDEG